MRSVKPQKVRNIEETCVEKCILENVRNGRGDRLVARRYVVT